MPRMADDQVFRDNFALKGNRGELWAWGEYKWIYKNVHCASRIIAGNCKKESRT